jgi:hypothetical protein
MNLQFNSLFWKLFLPVSMFLLLAIIAFSIYIPSAITNNARDGAVVSAQKTVNQFKALRAYYTKNVISRLVKESDITPHYNHESMAKSVPLPATMIHELSEQLSGDGLKIKLYSQYPFPNRSSRILDEFANDAWVYLNKHPKGV